MSRIKQVQLGLALIPLFPLVLALMLIGLLVVMFIGLALGLCCGGIMLMAFFGGMRRELKWVLIPILSVVAGGIGLILGLIIGVIGILMLSIDYFRLIPFLICYPIVKQDRESFAILQDIV